MMLLWTIAIVVTSGKLRYYGRQSCWPAESPTCYFPPSAILSVRKRSATYVLVGVLSWTSLIWSKVSYGFRSEPLVMMILRQAQASTMSSEMAKNNNIKFRTRPNRQHCYSQFRDVRLTALMCSFVQRKFFNRNLYNTKSVQ